MQPTILSIKITFNKTSILFDVRFDADHSFFLARIEMSLIKRGSIKLLSTILSTPEELLENWIKEGFE